MSDVLSNLNEDISISRKLYAAAWKRTRMAVHVLTMAGEESGSHCTSLGAYSSEPYGLWFTFGVNNCSWDLYSAI